MVNAGSTSLKLRVVDRDDRVSESVDCDPPGDSLEDDLRRFLASAGPLDAIGHRVVHGGTRFTRPTVMDTAIRVELEELSDLAPLHNPPALAAIDALSRLSPNVPAVACFDTAFHTSLKPAASSCTRSRVRGSRTGVCAAMASMGSAASGPWSCSSAPGASREVGESCHLPLGRRCVSDCNGRWTLG